MAVEGDTYDPGYGWIGFLDEACDTLPDSAGLSVGRRLMCNGVLYGTSTLRFSRMASIALVDAAGVCVAASAADLSGPHRIAFVPAPRMRASGLSICCAWLSLLSAFWCMFVVC